MTRNDGTDGQGQDEAAAAPDDALAAAETRILPEDDHLSSQSEGRAEAAADPAEQATVLAQVTGIEAEASEASELEDDATQLVTRMPSGIGSAPGTAAERGAASASAEDETVLSLDSQMPLAEAEEASATARGPKDTRVVESLASEAVARGAASATADTRVLDDSPKTAPPPVTAETPRAASDRASDSSPSPAAAPTPIDPERGLTPGTILFGEYEIVSVLGVGGMGEVYRARHRRLDEHRAIKVMHAELSAKKGASEFFYREAKALLAVRHPAVVHCHDLLSDDAGRVYLIMEMIEGIPLSKKMNDGPLSADDVAILGARVSHGLSAAHRKGVIHRDLSPDNIVLPRGRVREAKIIDFGIAKLLEEGEGTIVDGFKGKLSYASPEQLGFFGGKIDGRSDFYSLGLVLVAAARGRPMSMGTSVMEAVDARRALKSLPDDIPMGLRSAIQPLLALDPKDRPQYVDRLFVVPGGLDGSSDQDAFGAGFAAAQRSTETTASGASRTGLFAGIAAAVVFAIGAGVTFMMGGEGAVDSAASRTPTAEAGASERPPAGSLEATPVPVPAPAAAAVVPIPAVTPEARAEPEAIAAVPEAPAKPQPRRLSAGDRIRIIGLLSGAKMALEDNRLMSPANDNAYDRYRSVLDLDPDNSKAKDGLRSVATRYVSLADAALEKGDRDQARNFLGRARQADASYAGIRRLEARLSE